MVLDDVAQGAGPLVEAAPLLDAEGLGHGDLHVVDVAAVPQRLEDGVGEAQRQHVLHRLLPEVVVDPVDLRLVEDCGAGRRRAARALSRSRPNGFSITSRTAAPGCGGSVEPGRAEAGRRPPRTRSGWWPGRRCGCRECPARSSSSSSSSLQRGEGVGVVVVAGHVAAVLDHLVPARTGVGDRVDHQVAEPLVVDRRCGPRRPPRRRAAAAGGGRAAPGPGAACGRSGPPTRRTRPGRPAGPAAVGLQPFGQRVGAGSPGRLVLGAAGAALALSCRAWSSSSKLLAKDATPSSSSTCATSAMSMPTSARRVEVGLGAASTSASTVRATVPWSRKAATVASGMVLTVCGPIRLST